MKVSFRDISKVKKGTLTMVMINIKSVNEKAMIEAMHFYSNEKTGFNFLSPSTRNLKYYTRLNVVETEKLFLLAKIRYNQICKEVIK